MSQTVGCVRLDGEIIQVEKDELRFRPAVYGLILKDRQILLLRMRANGKYHLPGGGVEVGEAIEDTLIREVFEETGIKIEVEKFVHFNEIFFYYDPSRRAYHGLHFYYRCRPLTTAILEDDRVQDGSAEKPRWIDIDTLREDEFQADGAMILSLLPSEAYSRSTEKR